MRVPALLVMIVFLSVTGRAQTTPSVQGPTDVSVIKFSWDKERIGWERDPFGASGGDFIAVRRRINEERQTPEMIAAAALQEDVDAVGISILSGAHNTLCPRIVSLLREQGMDDCLVVVGGIVPQEDISRLKEQGVSAIFLPGTSTEDIVKFLRENVHPRE